MLNCCSVPTQHISFHMSISLALGLMANPHKTNKLSYMSISLALGSVTYPLTRNKLSYVNFLSFRFSDYLTLYACTTRQELGSLLLHFPKSLHPLSLSKSLSPPIIYLFHFSSKDEVNIILLIWGHFASFFTKYARLQLLYKWVWTQMSISNLEYGILAN